MFNIALEHTYFRDGRCSGVQLKPTGEAARLMDNTNLVSRVRDDGLTVFFDMDWIDSLRLYAKDEEEPLELNFEFQVEHQNFQNFTSPDLLSHNKLLYFDSRTTDPGQVGRKYLHVGDYVDNSELVDTFTSTRAASGEHTSFRRFSRDRALLFNAAQTAINPGVNNSVDAASLTRLGRELWQATQQSGRPEPSLGLVSIHVSPIELDRLAGEPSASFNDYRIRFNTRETHWKYFLIGDANQETAHIEDASGETTFDLIGQEALANGRMAKVFLSRQPIPLHERSKPKFQLKVLKNNRPKTLVNRLAVASAHRINKTVVDSRELVVSEIYVNF
ncbi:MAG: hypothetical protein ACE37D_14255 [Pseudomonadales bacterium]